MAENIGDDEARLQNILNRYEQRLEQHERGHKKWIIGVGIGVGISVGIGVAVGVGGAWLLWRPDKAQQALREAHKAIVGAYWVLNQVQQALGDVAEAELHQFLHRMIISQQS